MESDYQVPQIADYGDLLELTGHKSLEGAEDGCSKTVDGAVCESAPATP